MSIKEIVIKNGEQTTAQNLNTAMHLNPLFTGVSILPGHTPLVHHRVLIKDLLGVKGRNTSFTVLDPEYLEDQEVYSKVYEASKSGKLVEETQALEYIMVEDNVVAVRWKETSMILLVAA